MSNREILRFDDGIESLNPPEVEDSVLTRLDALETENISQQTDIDSNNTHRLNTEIHFIINDASVANNEVLSAEEVDRRIAALADSAPDTLNTLNELAAALGDDPNFATTVTNMITGNTNEIDSLKEKIDGFVHYFGDKNTDGTYRMRQFDGALITERRINGNYEEVDGVISE